jgi:hypothetical protein
MIQNETVRAELAQSSRGGEGGAEGDRISETLYLETQRAAVAAALWIISEFRKKYVWN